MYYQLNFLGCALDNVCVDPDDLVVSEIANVREFSLPLDPGLLIWIQLVDPTVANQHTAIDGKMSY